MIMVSLIFKVRSLCSDFRRDFRKFAIVFVSMRCRITFDSQPNTLKSSTCFVQFEFSCSFLMVALLWI